MISKRACGSISTAHARCSRPIRGAATAIVRGWYFPPRSRCYGAPFPDTIPDEFALTPLTSYGTQKAMVERCSPTTPGAAFSTASVSGCRTSWCGPGGPNKAASGFFSSIIREPLPAWKRCCRSTRSSNWHASPRAAVGFLVHAAGLGEGALGPRVNLTMPGVCCTVAEQIASLRRIAGDKVAARIRHDPDPMITRIVAGWPAEIRTAPRARARLPGRRLVRRHHPGSYR